jgi:hypothetical protein
MEKKVEKDIRNYNKTNSERMIVKPEISDPKRCLYE